MKIQEKIVEPALALALGLFLPGLVTIMILIWTGLWEAKVLGPVTKELQTLNKDLTKEFQDLKIEIVRLQDKPGRVSALEAAAKLAMTLPQGMAARPGWITADVSRGALVVRDEGQTWTFSFTGSPPHVTLYDPKNPETAKSLPIESLKSGRWGVVVHESGSQTATKIYQLPEKAPQSPSFP